MHEGQILHGRYRAIRQLGEGGMGDVWLARDTELPRDVAIKGVNRDPESVPGNRRRLELEAETLAGLNHDHIVPIIDRFIEDDQIYLAMKYIRGQSLDKAIEAGDLTDEEKVRVLTDVLDALAYLHTETPVVHRDLKPSNIILDEKHRAHVTDFGIALSLADPDRTRSAYVIGTLPFMAPEVRSGREATAASDVWSLGAIALQLFTGQNYDDGLPDGDFAGRVTPAVRAALSTALTKRPTAADLLQSIQSPTASPAAAAAGAVDAPTAPAVTGPAAPATLAFASAPTGPTDSVDPPQSKQPRYLRPLLALVLLVAVALLAAGLLQQRAPQATAPPPVPAPITTTDEPSPTPTPTTDSPTPSPTDSPSATPSPTDSAPVYGPTWVNLADVLPVTTEVEGVRTCDNYCSSDSIKPDTIAGTMYPSIIRIPLMSLGNRTAVTWNAYRKCTSFEATIGLDDNSPSIKAHFQLEREGGPTQDLGVLATGQTRHVTVDLNGVYRYRLAAYATAVVKNGNATAAWGDARMLCTGLPSASPQP